MNLGSWLYFLYFYPKYQLMNKIYYLFGFFALLFFSACKSAKDTDIPVVGFVEAFEDATIAQARQGFADALATEGFSEEKGNIKIIYRNAQGDIPTLTQIVNYFISENVDLIGTSTTLATISAVQRNMEIPVFMSVSSMPDLLGLTDKNGNAPANLFGTGENLDYIDTSFSIIPLLLKPMIQDRKIKVGMIYNQSEPQSVDAYQRIATAAQDLDVILIALPLNTSAEAQMVTRALLNKQIDAFFANPDNTVFAAFETIIKNCDEKNVPVFTSEAGLVERGAVAAFGADIYQWGYQSGLQAAEYLKNEREKDFRVEMVKIRKRIYNPEVAQRFGFVFPEGFTSINSN